MKKYVSLSKFLTEYNEKNSKNEFKPVAVGRYGIRARESIYSKELAKDYSKNKLIYKNTLTVGMGSTQIDIGVLTDDVIYSVSPAYHTYKIHDIGAEYLRYCLECRNQDMFSRYVKRGSRQGKTIDLKRWLTYEIPIFDAESQAKIVHNLQAVDTLIAQRKEQLELLDDLVKARFVEMFGDESIYDKEMLNDNVHEMFIGPFGSALKNEYFVAEEDSYCMVYEQKHAIQKTMDLPTRYIDEKKYNELKRFTVQGGDIIVSCRGTIGEIYSIPKDAPIGVMHPSIMKIRLKNGKHCNLFFVMMLNQYMRVNIAKANGSGIKMAVTATDLGREYFIVPPMDKQNEFADFVHQVDKSKLAVQKSLEELETLKKALMQEYFG